MPKPEHILIANADPVESAQLSGILADTGYTIQTCPSLAVVTSALGRGSCLAVLLDLDTISLDNRAIRTLTVSNPQVGFLCISSRRFHPELKEALSCHIFACLNKPVDPDELTYWIRCIEESEGGCRDGPGAGS